MSQVVVKEVRRITGFDRVMVYQFDETGSGSVIAEDTNQDQPYLGLRYPATDIPKTGAAALHPQLAAADSHLAVRTGAVSPPEQPRDQRTAGLEPRGVAQRLAPAIWSICKTWE